MSRKWVIRLAVVLSSIALLLIAAETPLFPLLRNSLQSGQQERDFRHLVTNQLLRPWGQQTMLRGRPVELAMDPAERWIAVLNSRSIEMLEASSGARLHTIPAQQTSYTGLAFRPGASELWASEATRTGPDALLVATLDEKGAATKTERIALKVHPVPAGIAFSPDGKKAYVALSANNTIAVMDAHTRVIEREVPVGMVPMSIVVAPRSGVIYVTNRGGRPAKEKETKGYSSFSEIVVDDQTGAAVSGRLSIIQLSDLSVRHADTGLAPAGVALSPDEKIIAVANAHSDSVSLFDAATLQATVVKIPSFPEGSFGSTPVTLQFSRDGKQLYVASGGINAITVLERRGRNWAVTGALPTGWFPTAVAVDRQGGLRVATIKGSGSTANKDGKHNSRELEGSVLTIPRSIATRVQAGLREVRAANTPQFEPLSEGVADLSSLGIQHVFLIIKENRTYDQVLSDIEKGARDPSLLMYGRDVTPNHHALAEEFVLLDNFYASGAISFDGHHWLLQGFVSDYTERAFAASPRGYAWNLADALTVSPAGFFWQGAPRPLEVRLYGAAAEPATFDARTGEIADIDESDLLPWTTYWDHYRAGTWRSVVGARAAVGALRPFTAPQFPVSTMNIPDQVRAQAWEEELREREKTGRMPNLCVFTLTADHTVGKRPGFPTPRAMVADNDLAMGRIVESISKSRFWEKSLILITEDDAQDGLDHVSGFRTIGLVVGPQVRRKVLDSTNYNHSSMVRTIQDIFRVPPRTRFLQSARPMASVFTREKNLEPFTALRPKVELTEMNPPLQALRGRPRWAAEQSLQFNTTEVDDIPHDVMNRILWWESKGYDKPFPEHLLHR